VPGCSTDSTGTANNLQFRQKNLQGRYASLESILAQTLK
jgi:hypothetical protein